MTMRQEMNWSVSERERKREGGYRRRRRRGRWGVGEVVREEMGWMGEEMGDQTRKGKVKQG